VASGPLAGDSELRYTDGGAQTYQLRVPLQALMPGMEWPAQWVAGSLDGTVYEHITVGSGIYLVAGLIRYENEPDELQAMVQAGQRGITLNWYPDATGAPGTFYACRLVTPPPGGKWVATRDPITLREAQLQIELARTDGSAFPAGVWD
jgi:hypothetical protein